MPCEQKEEASKRRGISKKQLMPLLPNAA